MLLSALCAALPTGAHSPQPGSGRAGGDTLPGAVVEVIAPLPEQPLVTVLDPRNPRQPVPAQDGAELLRGVPGFALARKGGTGGEPVLRGMAGSRLGILADFEATPGGCGGRMDPPTAYLYPEAFDRVQVLKGPQSVRYGPGHSAGTVLFQRDPPGGDPPWSARATWMLGGSGRDDRILAFQGATPRWDGRITGIRSRCGDYRDGDGRRVHSGYERWSLDGALGWTPTASTRLEARATRSDGQAAYADRGMDGVSFLRRNLGLALERRGLAPALELLEAQVFWNQVDHIMDNGSLRPFVPSPAAPGPTVRNPQRTSRGARFALTLQPDPASSWVLGGDLRLDRHTVRRSLDGWAAPVQDQPRLADAALDQAGLFGEWTRRLQSCSLISGLRCDAWRARDLRRNLALSGAGAPVPDPTAQAVRGQLLPSGFLRWERGLDPAGATLFAGLGHAQRAPDYWELFPPEAADSPSAFLLRPERSTQLDFGASARLGGTRLAFTGFCGAVEDFLLIQTGYPKTGPDRSATIARNVRAATWGGELALTSGQDGPLRLDGSLAWTQGQNRTDRRPLGQIPPAEARLGLAWDPGPWSVGSLARLVAPQDRFALGQGSIAGQDLGRTPGFAVFALNADLRPGLLRPLLEGLRISFGVDNLFDRAYVEHLNHTTAPLAGHAGARTRIPEPGRTVWFRLSYRLSG